VQVKTKNLIVGALVVLLVGALWYRVVYSPMESAASKAKSAARDADTTSANLRQALNGTSSANKKAKTKDASSASMLAAVPTDSAQATFLRNLETLRLASGAEWQSVTPTVPSLAGTVTSINVAISVQGSQEQIDRYVAGLAGMKRLFVIDNLAISPAGSTGSATAGPVQGHPGSTFVGDLFSAQIAGRIFSQPAAAAAATAGSTGTGTGGTATTPVTGAPAPTGQTGVQNN